MYKHVAGVKCKLSSIIVMSRIYETTNSYFSWCVLVFKPYSKNYTWKKRFLTFEIIQADCS